MKLLTLFTALMLTFVSARAQETGTARIVFERNVHNFGLLEEADGPVIFNFRFKNAGNAPLKIKSVKASCGCTVAERPDEPIEPGESDLIKVKYDPKDQAGPFTKTITVTTNATTRYAFLKIQGEVKPRPKTRHDIFKYKRGSLRFQQTTLRVGQLNIGSGDYNDTIDIWNNSDTFITVKAIASPKHFTFGKLPIVIPPDSIVPLPYTFKPQVKQEYGITTDDFLLITDDTDEPDKKIYHIAEVLYDPSVDPSYDRANGAQIKLNQKEVDFGTIKQGEKYTAVFKVTNTGKTPLQLIDIQTTCGCTVPVNQEELVAPGESTDLKVEFDSKGKKGRVRNTITVYTNDPQNKVLRLDIKANVLTGE